MSYQEQINMPEPGESLVADSLECEEAEDNFCSVCGIEHNERLHLAVVRTRARLRYLVCRGREVLPGKKTTSPAWGGPQPRAIWKRKGKV